MELDGAELQREIDSAGDQMKAVDDTIKLYEEQLKELSEIADKSKVKD